MVNTSRILLFFITSYLKLSKGFESTSSTWQKSAMIGSNPGYEILRAIEVRSLIQCVSQCSVDRISCLSVEYQTSTQTCKLLSSLTQDAPFVPTNDLVHYSSTIEFTTDALTTPTTTSISPTTTLTTTSTSPTTPLQGCPTGYSHLPLSNTCVKHWPNSYLPWHDSQTLCNNDGADLPILDTVTVFNEFQTWMDSNSNDRVAVHAQDVNGKYKWGNGVSVDMGKFCNGNPDMTGQSNVCVYMEDVGEAWCGSSTNRLDDSACSTESLRICMVQL